MLRLAAEKCTDLLLRHGTIGEHEKPVYLYGFELFWSTFLCTMTMLLLGLAFGYAELVAVFLLFFVPIRMAAGGYHAKSYGGCFILTNAVELACVFGAKWLYRRGDVRTDVILFLVLVLSFVYIWRHAPVILKKYPMKPEKVIHNRRCAHRLLAAEAAGLVLMNAALDGCIVYTAILTSCMVAIMIRMAEKGGA